ncbi:MAG: precorrin-8X methylmutase [Proteobacteria bacterium]|nr:precorrin-8X methylmutase [Pseudomonadota bacterium]
MFDYLRDPDEIYRRSFERLRAECDLSAVPDDLAPVALRLVHACAMPDILDDLAWDGEVAAAGRGALQAGAPVIADCRMTMDGVIRARRQSLPEGVLNFNAEHKKLELRSLEDFGVAYERVKAQLGRKDFNDMLMEYIENDYGSSPIKALFLDEAQDFSKLQWDFISKLCANGVERLYLAGDDDQAVFTFTGSDEYGFLDFPAEENEVLTKSWRCPVRVGKQAEQLTARLRRRKPKVVEWQDKPGAVTWAGATCQEMPWQRWAQGDQQVMLLARHRRKLWAVRKHLRHMGVPTTMDGKISATKVVEIAIIYHDVKAGREISCHDAARLLWWFGFKRRSDNLRKRTGRSSLDDLKGIDFDTPWISYLSKTRDEEKELAEMRIILVAQGIDILRGKPMIDVSTYHSSKGREADVVVCLTDCSKAVWEEQARNPDGEIRLAYVGLTRTKNECIVLPPTKPKQMVGLKP